MRVFLILMFAILGIGCSNDDGKPNAGAKPAAKAAPLPVAGYEIVKSYPHDPKAFTQGLLFHDGFLYESTGQKGESTLRKVELETGKVVQKVDLPKDSFAEGITLLNGKIYQLTWQEGVARVYDINGFKLLNEFGYQGDGWGLTTDGTNLFMTDSTHIMRILNPETFRSTRMLAVMRDDGRPMMAINEMEFVKGEIWANIWHSERAETLGKTNHIVRIDPATGKILGWIDLTGISPEDQPPADYKPSPTAMPHPKEENTLNGIAYDAANDRIFVTGKLWKKLYEIKIKPPVQ